MIVSRQSSQDVTLLHLTAIKQLRTSIVKGHHTFVVGRSGIGKTALLAHCSSSVSSEFNLCTLRLQPVTIRQALLDLAQQCHAQFGLRLPVSALPPTVATKARNGRKLNWSEIRKPVNRLTVDDLLKTIVRTIEPHRSIIFVDSLEVPPTYFDALEVLTQHAEIIAAMDSDNRRNRAVKFVSSFPVKIELKPLPLEDSEKLIRDHLAKNPIRFTDRKTESLFVRRVAQEGRGVSGTIINLLEAATGEDRITPAKVRMIQSDAAVTYMDMTPALVIVLAGVMALRYIGRGIGETELIVISGVGTSLFIVIRFLFFAIVVSKF